MTSRLMLLRRPATLCHAEGPFVPAGTGVLDDVEQRWAKLSAENPAYYDGRLLHVLGVHRNGHGGASIHVMDCAYRFHAVQSREFDLGVRSLGVKAITCYAGRVLLGLRSQRIGAYRGLWEFAPGGVVEPGRRPVDVIRDELAEETGVAARDPTALAVVYDDVLRCWELVYRIEATSDELLPQTDEYDELRWCPPDTLAEPLTPVASRMRALVPRLRPVDENRP